VTKQSGYATKQTGYFWTKQLGLNSMFSDHIRMSLPVRDELRKFKGWKVELKNRLDFYYCDNESCSEEYFPARIQVGLTEKRSNFLYITKQKENEKIIRDLFGLS